jgi:hypothetical protein
MLGPSSVRPPPKPPNPNPPKPAPIALESAWTIYHSIPLLQTKDTPVLPPRPIIGINKYTLVLHPCPIVRFGLPSKAATDIRLTAVLGEYTPFNLDALDSEERAGSQQTNLRKQRSADVPLKQVKVVVSTANGNQSTDQAVDNNRCHIGFNQQMLEKDHPKVWPPSLISILQQTMATPCHHPLKPIFEFNLNQLHQATSPQQLHQAMSP